MPTTDITDGELIDTDFGAARPDARPWLYGIATNLLRRHHREEVRQYRAWARTGTDPVAEGPADRVVDRVDAGAWSGQLAAALARLKAPDRDVLLLFAWAAFSYEEIAQALTIPVGTVRSRAQRRRQHRATELGSAHERLAGHAAPRPRRAAAASLRRRAGPQARQRAGPIRRRVQVDR